jgi:hypothetical protein
VKQESQQASKAYPPSHSTATNGREGTPSVPAAFSYDQINGSVHRSLTEGLKPPKILNRMAKRAIVTGITGQNGSYLAELLLAQGYEVTGVIRRLSTPDYWRIEHILDRIMLRPADLLDQLSIIRVIDEVQPDDVMVELKRSITAATAPT